MILIKAVENLLASRGREKRERERPFYFSQPLKGDELGGGAAGEDKWSHYRQYWLESVGEQESIALIRHLLHVGFAK